MRIYDKRVKPCHLDRCCDPLPCCCLLCRQCDWAAHHVEHAKRQRIRASTQRRCASAAANVHASNGDMLGVYSRDGMQAFKIHFTPACTAYGRPWCEVCLTKLAYRRDLHKSQRDCLTNHLQEQVLFTAAAAVALHRRCLPRQLTGHLQASMHWQQAHCWVVANTRLPATALQHSWAEYTVAVCFFTFQGYEPTG